MTRTECGFCGNSGTGAELVQGQQSAICHPCVSAGLASIIASSSASAATELQTDSACWFCEKQKPARAVYLSSKDVGICSSCLARAYRSIAGAGDFERRETGWHPGTTPRSLVEAHFERVDLAPVVTSARTFPEYLRVDLNKQLAELFAAPAIRCIGLKQEYAHETLEYAALFNRQNQVTSVPLQYDEIDVGEERPVRCLKNSLWFVPGDECPHIVLLSKAQRYGESSGWHVEVVVPGGERGEKVTRTYFDALEAALRRSVSYRGKVLSLEKTTRTDGKGAAVAVHRLAAVRREEVILPRKTLELLERNVFKFANHRAALAARGLPVKKGLLFYGPPGTGKTHTIRYLANALPGHTTLLVTAEQVGGIEEYMTLARLLSPSILVIEDADLIARQREEMGSPCEEVLLNRLLNEMDGLQENTEILFVLTTNRPEALEFALTARPGRIDQAIEFPLPDAEGRTKLACLYAKTARLSSATLEHVVERTNGVSAAFIKELMRRSLQFALERDPDADITEIDVDAALDELLFSGGRLNASLLGAAGAQAIQIERSR